MRFALWGRDAGGEPRHKGEIVLLRTGDTDAVGEIVHLADATDQPAPGDGLSLLGEGPGLSPDLEEGGVLALSAETALVARPRADVPGQEDADQNAAQGAVQNAGRGNVAPAVYYLAEFHCAFAVRQIQSANVESAFRLHVINHTSDIRILDADA